MTLVQRIIAVSFLLLGSAAASQTIGSNGISAELVNRVLVVEISDTAGSPKQGAFRFLKVSNIGCEFSRSIYKGSLRGRHNFDLINGAGQVFKYTASLDKRTGKVRLDGGELGGSSNTRSVACMPVVTTAQVSRNRRAVTASRAQTREFRSKPEACRTGVAERNTLRTLFSSEAQCKSQIQRSREYTEYAERKNGKCSASCTETKQRCRATNDLSVVGGKVCTVIATRVNQACYSGCSVPRFRDNLARRDIRQCGSLKACAAYDQP